MKDKRGLYYYPFPQNQKIRMYILMSKGEICFRLWNNDDIKLWEEHGWVPYSAIKQAITIYDGSKFNPDEAYDIEIAKSLIAENEAFRK
ncbi:MAG: hypothetical protein FP814_00410 [Desulfobacterium sp.]|nr:hypothetical protein [Desulfobacterium sp.]MBU3949697.1 hypothetical protein [Pseudomonadota bacterium]MBU4010823.1 hypothetical protein [Pseudomonadota bacterium]MBU4036791.1 hypothetical protein [Pseudomonadota bacterium]